MSARRIFNTLHCREAAICDETAIASYSSASPEIPVGQVIAARPLTTSCNSFSFVIVNTGTKGCISIGLVHRHYPAHRQPGWDPMSIAYHADDGGIFHGRGRPIVNVASVGVGGIMTCTLDFEQKIVTFYRNYIQVYKSGRLQFPPGGFHPTIGFHSFGESVCVLERDPWLPGEDQVDHTEVVYHSLQCREVQINHTNGMLSYYSTSPDIPVGQFIGARPLTPNCNRVSFVIVHPGTKRCIVIGLCHQHYPANRQPGWEPMSIGYHADDGRIYAGAGTSRTSVGEVRVGEMMECRYNFTNNTVTFFKNGHKVYKSGTIQIPVGGFYPVVGFHSFGETVHLLDKHVWQSPENTQLLSSPPPSAAQHFEYHVLACREATIDQDHGYISYDSAEPNVPVAQVIAKHPLTANCNKFSIVIIVSGLERCMSVGLCDRRYPVNRQPGWSRFSIGYHADDGGIFIEHGSPHVTVQSAQLGDKMTCELTFPETIAKFYLNDRLVYESRPLRIPLGGFHPVVGLHSYGEVVRLVEMEPWSDTPHTGQQTDAQHTSSSSSTTNSDVTNSDVTNSEMTNSNVTTPKTVINEPRVSVGGLGAAPPADSSNDNHTPSLPLCGICMEKPVDCFLNPCGHTFCNGCVQEWRARSRECPTCRNQFTDYKTLYF